MGLASLSRGTAVVVLVVLSSRRARAQASHACSTDRAVSTLVGAGLGAAAAAIPATIVHRHDAGRGTLAGAVIGGRARSVGGAFYNVGCDREPCNATRPRAGVMLSPPQKVRLRAGSLEVLSVGRGRPTGRRRRLTIG